MQPLFSRTFYSWCGFLQANKAHAIFPQTTVFVSIFLWICSDDNECMNDDDKYITMITNLQEFAYVCL